MADIMIKYPVHYERRGTYIFDADQNMVANVRGWGRISYMENPEEKQDAMGEFIAQAINEKLMGEKAIEHIKSSPVCGWDWAKKKPITENE